MDIWTWSVCLLDPLCRFMVSGWRIQLQPLTHGVELEAGVPAPPGGQRCAADGGGPSAAPAQDPPPEALVGNVRAVVLALRRHNYSINDT